MHERLLGCAGECTFAPAAQQPGQVPALAHPQPLGQPRQRHGRLRTQLAHQRRFAPIAICALRTSSLRPDSPALRAGFQPIDFAQAGLQGDAK